MGTHGRNAITRNGEHWCCEQPFDGHDAATVMLLPFLEEGVVPNFEYPTMDDQTLECDHGYNFTHIDYDNQIVYTGLSDYRILIDDPVEVGDYWGLYKKSASGKYLLDHELIDKKIEEIKRWKENIRELEMLGWMFFFEVEACPPWVKCENNEEWVEQCPFQQLRHPNFCIKCSKRIECLVRI